MITPQESHAQWRAERHHQVTGPTGNLALVAFEIVDQPMDVALMPVRASPSPDGEGLIIEPRGDGVTLDGRPVVGPTLVRRMRPGSRPLVAWRSLAADVFSLDGSGDELRIFDAQAQALTDFDRIECYPHDLSMVLPARFARHDGVRQVAWDFTRDSDKGHTKKVPGVICLDVAGQSIRLSAILDGPDLVLVFSDATTGRESYAPGRFMRMPCPADDGRLALDLNRAFIPPCGFSSFYSCPMPPRENHLPMPVRAGEQRVLWKSV